MVKMSLTINFNTSYILDIIYGHSRYKHNNFKVDDVHVYYYLL